MNYLHSTLLLANAALVAAGIFVPLLAQELGINYFELGVVSAAFWLGSVISYYLFGRLSDAWGEKSKLIKAGFLVSSIFFFAQLFINDFTSFAVLRFLAGFAIGIYAYPMVSLAASKEKYKKEIGALSAFGALGWFAGSAIAAVFTEIRTLFAISGALFLIAFIISLRIPSTKSPKMSLPLFPASLLRKNFRVYATYFLRHFGASAFWVVQPLFLLELGADKFWIAAILALNPLTQFFIMRKAGELAENKAVDEKKLIRLGALASALVFVAYALIPNFYYALLISLLIAFAWSLLYVGSMVYLTSRNAEKASATGLLGSVLSLASVAGLFAGGAVAQAFGIKATLAFAVAVCAASLIVSKDL